MGALGVRILYNVTWVCVWVRRRAIESRCKCRFQVHVDIRYGGAVCVCVCLFQVNISGGFSNSPCFKCKCFCFGENAHSSEERVVLVVYKCGSSGSCVSIRCMCGGLAYIYIYI